MPLYRARPHGTAGQVLLYGPDGLPIGDAGLTYDTAADALSLAGDLVSQGQQNFLIRQNTADGSDTKQTAILGGGAFDEARGGLLMIAGNEHATVPGYIRLQAGNVSGSKMTLIRGDGTSMLEVVSGQDYIDFPKGQLKFPATQNASAGANTFDDYEETTWTPVLDFGGASTGITYTTQEGFATKWGRAVHFECRIVLSNKGSATGVAHITVLPFTAGGNSIGICDVPANGASLPGGTTGVLFTFISSTTLFPSLDTRTLLDNTYFTNTTDIRCSGVYYV